MKKLITSRTKNNKPIMIKLNKRLIYNHKQMNGSFIKISKIITDVEKDWEDWLKFDWFLINVIVKIFNLYWIYWDINK